MGLLNWLFGRDKNRKDTCCLCYWYSAACLDGIENKGICNFGTGQQPPFTMSAGDRVKIAWSNQQTCENFKGQSFGRAEAAPICTVADLPRLLKDLVGEDVNGSFQAGRDIGQLGEKSAVGPLIDAMQHEYYYVRCHAYGALIELTGFHGDCNPREPEADAFRTAVVKYQKWWTDYQSQKA